MLMADSQISDAERTALLGRAAASRASLAVLRGYDAETAFSTGNQALAQLPASDNYWRSWAITMVGITYYLVCGDVA
jgi:hypothetical protein